MRSRKSQGALDVRHIGNDERRRIAWAIAEVLAGKSDYRQDLTQAGVIAAHVAIGDKPTSSGLLATVMFRGMLHQMRCDKRDNRRCRALSTCSLEANHTLAERLAAPDASKDVDNSIVTDEFINTIRSKASQAELEIVDAIIDYDQSVTAASVSLGISPCAGIARLRTLKRKLQREYSAYRRALAI